ncbi:hypothetical protein B0H13DRAFT_1877368 [Mycena leptocephala]|nr:hypothetical protein B0H13DRAFT_1877368 [Mycena leptocephala]
MPPSFTMNNTIESNITAMSRNLVPTIVDRTKFFPELTLMFIQGKPEKACVKCTEKGCGCTFDGWSNNCRECCLSMTTGCTFASLWEWTEFVKADNKKTIAYLKTHTDYKRQVEFERYTALYPFVGEYFRASAVASPFKTHSAFANLVSSFDTELVVTLFNLAKEYEASSEICDTLFASLVCFNASVGHGDNKVIFKYQGEEGALSVASAFLIPERRRVSVGEMVHASEACGGYVPTYSKNIGSTLVRGRVKNGCQKNLKVRSISEVTTFQGEKLYGPTYAVGARSQDSSGEETQVFQGKIVAWRKSCSSNEPYSSAAPAQMERARDDETTSRALAKLEDEKALRRLVALEDKQRDDDILYAKSANHPADYPVRRAAGPGTIPARGMIETRIPPLARTAARSLPPSPMPARKMPPRRERESRNGPRLPAATFSVLVELRTVTQTRRNRSEGDGLATGDAGGSIPSAAIPPTVGVEAATAPDADVAVAAKTATKPLTFKLDRPEGIAAFVAWALQPHASTGTMAFHWKTWGNGVDKKGFLPSYLIVYTYPYHLSCLETIPGGYTRFPSFR